MEDVPLGVGDFEDGHRGRPHTAAGKDPVGGRHFQQRDVRGAQRQRGGGLQGALDPQAMGQGHDVLRIHPLLQPDGCRVERVLEREPHRHPAVPLVVEILGLPGRAVGQRVRNRGVLEHGGEGNPAQQGRGVGKRLERRSRLAARLPGPVELARPVVVPADHGADGSGLGIEHDHGALVHIQFVVVCPVDPRFQDRLGLRLPGEIERRVDAEPALVQHVFAVPLEQRGEDVTDEPRRPDADEPRVALLHELDRRQLSRPHLHRRDVPEFDHPLEDLRPARHGPIGTVVGGVVRGGPDQPGQQRALRQREVLGRLPEVHFRGRLHAVGALSEIHLVEVALEDLVLGQPPFDLHRQQHLGDLSAERLLVREEEVSGELLRDRAAPLRQTSLADIPERGPEHAAERDPVVAVEARILGIDHRPLKRPRDL